jgi:hypothetical protein
VEIAVEIFGYLLKKYSAQKFSTFPQAIILRCLWKCGKLEVKYMKIKK